MKNFIDNIKRDKDGNVDSLALAKKLKKQPVQERVLYSRSIGATLSGRRPIYNQIQNRGRTQSKSTGGKENPNFGFNTLKYAIKEDKGPLIVKILNKTKKAGKVGIRTIECTATEGLDYEKILRVLRFESGQESQSIEIGIVDDDIVEPDENFFVELFDPDSYDRLPGKDTVTEVIIIDNDRPGTLTFGERLVKVSEQADFAEVEILRVDGSDGLIGCRAYSKEKEDEFDKAYIVAQIER